MKRKAALNLTEIKTLHGREALSYHFNNERAHGRQRGRKTEHEVRERVVEIQYTREILRESEKLYSDTSGSTWQSSGPPNYNLLHAVCYTTMTRGEEEDVRWREEEETTHTHTEET